MKTEEKIIQKAKELFNIRGIEYVGMRELAAELDMRIGNITYYFPTKDELVARISEEYTTSNNAIYATYPMESLYDFFARQSIIFDNMLGYRGIMLSMVHLMEQNSIIAAYYEKVKKQRVSGLEYTIRLLKEKKYLQLGSGEDEWVLISINSLLVRFWMSEAVLSGKRTQLEKQKNNYLKLLALCFKPYATAKGKKELEKFVNELST